MSASANKNIWGGIVGTPQFADGEKILRVQTGPAELGRLLEYWAKLPEKERPDLQGLSACSGAGAGASLELLLSQGKNSALSVLEVSPAAAFPRPSSVWAYSVWWEEELRTFSGVEFAGMIPERDASWRPL